MIKVLLMGGVGNRLFQVAHAHSIRRLDMDVCLIELPKKFEIFARVIGWSVHSEWVDVKKIAAQHGLDSRQAKLLDLAEILIVYALRKTKFKSVRFDMNLEFLKKRGGRWSIGYFQSSKHVDRLSVDNIVDCLNSELNIHKKEYGVIHIRGGDFDIGDRILPAVVNSILRKDENVKVVTNDKQYAIKTCGVPERKVISGDTALADFKLLASSAYIYPSESTFSFWASQVVIRNGGCIREKPDSEMWSL